MCGVVDSLGFNVQVFVCVCVCVWWGVGFLPNLDPIGQTEKRETQKLDILGQKLVINVWSLMQI